MAESKRTASSSAHTSRAKTKAKSTSSSGTRAASSQAKKSAPAPKSRSTSSSSRRAATATAASAEQREPGKEQLIEQLTARLRKLKKEELASLVARVDSGTLDFARLGLSGEGGFGFQERLEPEQRREADDGDDDRDGDRNSGPLTRAGDLAKGAVGAAKDALGRD